jgi:hypothetical protein
MTALLCQRCEELLDEYRQANRKLAAATKRVSEAARSWEFEFFHHVWLDAQATHAECTRLRRAFLDHIEQHPR